MFPLSAVLLPGGVISLRVFEDRYVRMLADISEGNVAEPAEANTSDPNSFGPRAFGPKAFGTVLIERGSEVGGGDVRSTVGTMAHIVDQQPTPTGGYILLAVGRRRIRVREWLPDDPYPRAVTEDWPDEPDPPGQPDEATMGNFATLPRLTINAVKLQARLAGIGEDEATSLLPDLSRFTDLSELAFLAAGIAPLGPLDRHKILTAPSAAERVATAHALIRDMADLLVARLELEQR